MSHLNLDSLSRDQLIYLARLAEQAERYDEMIDFVKRFIRKEPSTVLSVEERNIMSVAYKNIVGARRSGWRVLSSIEQKEERRGNAEAKSRATNYKRTLETELRQFCDEILAIIDNELLPQVSDTEGRVFYLKMKGDYYRYMAEFLHENERHTISENAQTAYTQAYDICKEDLAPTHPTRLGLALNFSVFYYEIMNKKTEACNMAQAAFDEALPELDNIGEENYKDTTLILQLLRDNLTLWKSESGDD